MSRYGEFQRELRKRREMYLGDLAKKLSCTAAYISDIELGRKKPPKAHVVHEIASYLCDTEEEKLKLVSLAETDRQRWTFDALNRNEDEAEFITALARAWYDGPLPAEKIKRMKAVLVGQDEEFD